MSAWTRKRMIPEDKGRLVTAFLTSFFKRYVEFDFTADLEEQLDLISADKLKWKDVLRDFWKDFTGNVDEIKDLRITEVLDALNELLGPHVFPDKGDGTDPRKCPTCDDGILSLKVGRGGAFVGCSNYPDCRFTRNFSQSTEEAGAINPDGEELGKDPETGLIISLRTGRFGPYIQLGEQEGDEKPKRASIPKTWDPKSIDLEKAIALISLPRTVGDHPETGKEIVANFGRYGPYVLHDGTYANLESPDDVFTIGLNHAVTVLADKKSKGPKRATALKELGEHPEEGGPVQVMDGRYGPYVKHGKINATLPKDMDVEKVTMEEAVALIAAKAAKAPKKKAAAKKTTKAKTTTKKTAAKKTTAKKTTARKTTAKKTATTKKSDDSESEADS